MKSLKKIPHRAHKDRRLMYNTKDKVYREDREVDSALCHTLRRFILPELLLMLITLVGCIMAESYFLTSCCIYNLVNGLVRFGVLYKLPVNKEIVRVYVSKQKIYTRCIAGNSLLLIASLYLLGASGLLFFINGNIFDSSLGILLFVFQTSNLWLAFACYIKLKKYTGVFIKSYRFMIYANVLVSAAFLISVLLVIYEEQADLIGLNGIVLGGCAAGLTGYILWNMLLINEKNKERYHHFRKNSTIIFTRLSLMKDIILVIGKIVLSCITLSAFMFANALYSAGMGIARFSAISAQDKDKQKQIQSYFHIGAAILGASLCYVVYSLKTFSAGTSMRFDMSIALIIALYTFTEFGLIIKEYRKARKTHNIISEEIKLIGLSSTFISLVLTQAAIMSFAADSDNNVASMLSGLFFGGMSAIIGVYMMIRSRNLKNRYQIKKAI
jgi:hypothetical protein